MDSDSKLISLSYYILRKIFGPIIRIVWVKKVTGLENIPKSGSAILVFNHQSFFDFLCFVAVSPRNVHFLSAEKFFNHKLWKHLMRWTGQIKVERQAHDKGGVHDLVKKHIDKRTLIGIFPEGTRSPHQHEMLKAFTGAGRYSLEHRVPIIPIGIKGTFEINSRDSKKVIFKKFAELHVGKPLHFTEHYGRHAEKDICTLVTEKAIKEIEKLSGKKYPHYEFNHE